MDLAYYNLGVDPFRLIPDLGFRFLHPRYAQALTYLAQTLRQGAGLVVLTGRPGTGKTLLVNELCTKRDDEKVHCVRVTAAALDSEELSHAIAAAFESVGAPAAGEKPLHRLKDFLQRQADTGHRYIVAIDEVQENTLDAIAQVAALAGLFTAEKRPLLQILVAGPPSLARRLEGIGVVCEHELSGLDEHETSMFIEHRLWHAGWQGDPQITPPAFKAIHTLTQGIPRGINLICGRLLLYGAHEGRHELDVPDVHTVAAELREEMLLDSECLPGLAASHPPQPERPQDPLSATAPDSSHGVRKAEYTLPTPAHQTRPADGAWRTMRKTNAIDRRNRARRRTTRYAAAGSLLTVTLLAALYEYEAGTDFLRELSFADRFEYLVEHKVNALEDRAPETAASSPRETTPTADENLGAFEDSAGPSPAPIPPIEASPATLRTDDVVLQDPTQAQGSMESGVPEDHAVDAVPNDTDTARDSARPGHLKNAANGVAPLQQQISGYQVTQVNDYKVSGRDCRRYTLEATIAGKRQRLYGTACRQPDGTWGAVQYPEEFYRPVGP